MNWFFGVGEGRPPQWGRPVGEGLAASTQTAGDQAEHAEAGPESGH